MNITNELFVLAAALADTAESSRDLQRNRRLRRRMVAGAEANLTKAKADHQRTLAECAAKLEELDAKQERIDPILKEMDELLAVRPMTDEIRAKLLKLGNQLIGAKRLVNTVRARQDAGDKLQEAMANLDLDPL